MAGLRRGAAAAALVLAAGLGLTACGGGANGDAIATCHGVKLALAAYARSRTTTAPAARRADLLDARRQLALVQSDAAFANSADGSYDALMTLVQEGQVMPMADVAPALAASCKAITSPTSYL